MKAPEKLYIALDELTEDERTFVLGHDVDYPICTEYTRTDAFIEKACEWLKENTYFYVNDYTGSLNEENLIEDFRKAMNGE